MGSTYNSSGPFDLIELDPFVLSLLWKDFSLNPKTLGQNSLSFSISRNKEEDRDNNSIQTAES